MKAINYLLIMEKYRAIILSINYDYGQIIVATVFGFISLSNRELKRFQEDDRIIEELQIKIELSDKLYAESWKP